MEFRIRTGRRDDAEFLALVMLSASRSHLKTGIWNLIIGADDAGCMDYLRRLALTEPRSLYHCESHLIAEVDGRPAAALTGFATANNPWAAVGEAMSNVQRDLGWTEADVAASLQRGAPVWACFLPDVGDFAIENVATLPEFQRRGLSEALVNRTIEDARRRGYKLIQISAYIGNDPARAVYEKCGFQVVAENRCSDVAALLGAPGFMRLTRNL
jgi:ribosomal protein S18 acetylase RimI-like enzyme